MEDLCDSFAALTLEPTFFLPSERPDLEYTFRDCVLRVVVPQVEFTEPWEWDQPAEATPATLNTLQCLRDTCSAWRDFVEGTAEWAALTLARYEFECLVPPTWSDEEEFVSDRFQKYRGLFSTCYWLPRPLENDLWRTSSLDKLTAPELQLLSLALDNAQPFGCWTHSAYRHPTKLLWICPDDRRCTH